jgi:transposase
MVTTTKSLHEQDSITLQSIIESTSHKNESTKPVQPDPQVKAASRTRRTFTKAYKLKILATYDACSNASERGALLRREGLYQTRITCWRKQFGSNEVVSKSATKTQRTDHLVREVEQLKKKLAQAQAVIDLQKKVSELLGTHILSHESSEVNL